jgi:hypothetical protein
MRAKVGFAALMVVVVIGVDLIATHLMMPPEKISQTLSPDLYRLLIVKWFVAGVALGLLSMFFLIEAWIWRNWKSWNRYCCDHHEKVYQAQMGISQGRMLRR